ncbi:metalloprotease, partial [Bisporella sp. PMI_857]
ETGSWSYVGTDSARYVPDQNQPTMNFGWFDEHTSDEEFSRTVIHEFGHAIGCIHEHQSPAATIKWDEAKVIADARATMGWDEAKTRHNILQRYNASETSNTTFDRNSIMCYWFPASWTLDGVGTPTNLVLSDTDKAFINKMYPFRTRNEGRFSTNQARSWYPPVALNSRLIQFDPPYLEAPRITLGLTSLDMEHTSNIRINAHTAPVQQRNGNDFVLNLDTWWDSALYMAAATWLEFQGQETDFQVGEFDTLTQRNIGEPRNVEAGGIRRDVKHISFPAGVYSEPPNVVVWLKAFDLSNGANWRVRALAQNITSTGFDLSIESWADTVIYGATASYVAYPKGKEGVLSGTACSTDHRNWYPAQLANGARVNFAKAFDKEPKVFLAISQLDIDSARNLRINAFADNVSAEGFNWHADAWADTLCYSAGVDWIAFG